MGPNGVPYYVQSVDDELKLKKLFGVNAHLESIAIIPVDEAPFAAGLSALSKVLGGSVAQAVVDTFSNLFTSNSMTKVSLERGVGTISVGGHDIGTVHLEASTFYSLFPDHLEKGLAKPTFSLGVDGKYDKFFADSQGDVAGWANFTHGVSAAATYDSKDREGAFGVKEQHKFGDFTLGVTEGKGSTLTKQIFPGVIGNMTTNPSSNPLTGNSGFLLDFSVSYDPNKATVEDVKKGVEKLNPFHRKPAEQDPPTP